MNLPSWLGQNECPPLPVKKFGKGRPDYLEKTLADIQKIMAEDMYQAMTVDRLGFLQLLNPHVKLVGFCLLLLASAMTGSIPALLTIHGLLILTALVSNIGLHAYLLRTWLPAGFFAGIAVLPGVLSWVTPGQPLLVIYQGAALQIGAMTLPTELAVTKQGMTAAALVIMRSAASLGLVLLLVKTTRWSLLTKALGRIGMPGLFVMVLDLTYRYLFLFLLLLSDYLLGRRSRLVGVEGIGAKLSWIGGALAGFLRLSGEYSKEIAAAMQARGYDGENHNILPSLVGPADIGFFVIVVMIVVFMLGGTQIAGIFYI